MTVKNAIFLAKNAIKNDVEYLQYIKQISAKDSPSDKILAKINSLVSTIAFNEICLCLLIIQELKSENDAKGKKNKRTRMAEKSEDN